MEGTTEIISDFTCKLFEGIIAVLKVLQWLVYINCAQSKKLNSRFALISHFTSKVARSELCTDDSQYDLKQVPISFCGYTEASNQWFGSKAKIKSLWI